MTVGMRIKMLREDEHIALSQRAFAARINVAGATVAQFESGTRSVKDIHISAICREFNVNEQWLRTGEGEMFSLTSESFVDQLMREHKGLDEMDRTILIEYMRLPPSSRGAIKDYLMRMVPNLLQAYEKGGLDIDEFLRNYPPLQQENNQPDDEKAHP